MQLQILITGWIALTPAAPAGFVEDNVDVLRFYEGESVFDNFGWAAETVGDLNEDSVSEYLISAINVSETTLYDGATGTALQTFTGSGLFGYAINGAGDVNADGVPDFVIGGLPVLVISGADYSVIHDLTAITGFGHGVAGTGDVNGDGHDDLVIGSERILNVSEDGRVFVISGATADVLWTRDGSPNSNLGSAVGSLADVSGDGVRDIIVGSQGAGPNQGGEVYLYSGLDGTLLRTLTPADPSAASRFGQFFAKGAGDVDQDGTEDVYVGDYEALGGAGETYIFSGKSGDILHRFAGFDSNDGFGPGRSIPDVNGDGHPDVFIGAYTDGDGAPGAGKTYLFSGRSGALLQTITATLENDFFGVDALAVGDVNRDGRTDYLVTAVGQSFFQLDAGRAYVLAGTELPCPADLNGNGWVGVFDLIQLLRLARDENPTGDLNGDRTVDESDFNVLFADLGRCGSPR